MAGTNAADYESAVDSQTVYNGHPSAYLRCKSSETREFGQGTLMQTFTAGPYYGHRVRFSGYVRADAVQNWAGLWMRVDRGSGDAKKSVSFDNMQDRPIKGTTGWQLYEVVLDVPDGSTAISLGILMVGAGTVWLNSFGFEIVPKSVPLTGRGTGDGPVNLSFDK
jgi:hypothetical protein